MPEDPDAWSLSEEYLAHPGNAEGQPSLPLEITAGLVGGYRWIEQALFELLGSWVVDIPLAGVKIHLDAQSARHGWHAELWGDRLPVMFNADPDGLTRPPEPAGRVLATLAGQRPSSASSPRTGKPGWAWETPEDDDTALDRPGALPRLAGLYRVIMPRLVVSYGRHLRAASAVADAPLIRTLRLVLADELEDWHAGERLVQRLMTRPHDVEAVHPFLQRLEKEVVGSSLTSGLVRLPGHMGLG
ncbi:MAG: hypothetical protein ACYCV7_05410 [Acidimicrobiales bacterium]